MPSIKARLSSTCLLAGTPLTKEDKQALSYAAKKNVLLVTATGNDGWSASMS